MSKTLSPEMESVLALAALKALAKKGTGLVRPVPPKDSLEWAKRYRFIDGKPFTLQRFLPLEGIYTDTARRRVIMKPAQRGVSELAINFAMFALEYGAQVWTKGEKEGLNVAYIFPTLEALGDFSKERLSGLEEESAHLARLFGVHDEYNAVRFKQVGKSYLYLRGGASTRGLKTFPADVLLLDEFDEMARRAVALARRRMNASEVGIELDLSTPSVPGWGIHEAYLASDRRVYQQYRACCGEWVTHDFFRDVRVDGRPWSDGDGGGWRVWSPDRVAAELVTLHCQCGERVSEVDRLAPGRWVVTNPGPEVHGYHVPWWPWPFLHLTEVAQSAVNPDPMEREQFYHSDLGLPYGSGGKKILLEDVLAMTAGEQPEGAVDTVVLGVDVGTRLHYWASGLSSDPETGAVVEVALETGALSTFEELDELMERRSVRLAVIDAMPETHEVAKLKDRFPGRVVSAGYPTGATALKSATLAPNKEGRPDREAIVGKRHVQVNRTAAMDAVSSLVTTRAEWWPSEVSHDPEVQAHLTSPTRVVTLKEDGEQVANWVHSAPDHLFHARVYAWVARQVVVPMVAAVTSDPGVGAYHADRGGPSWSVRRSSLLMGYGR